jgi:hypothetical protein
MSAATWPEEPSILRSTCTLDTRARKKGGYYSVHCATTSLLYIPLFFPFLLLQNSRFEVGRIALELVLQRWPHPLEPDNVT